jgi:hypothetical protein
MFARSSRRRALPHDSFDLQFTVRAEKLWGSAACLYSSVYLALLRAGLLNCVSCGLPFGFLTLSPLSVKLMQPYSDPFLRGFLRTRTFKILLPRNLREE